MSVCHHASESELALVGAGYLFAQARASAFRDGFFDQTGHLWFEAGRLVPTTHQLVYYKE